MGSDAPLFWLTMLIISQLLVVAFAVACWRWGSPSTRRAKQPPFTTPTPPSAPDLARVEADQAELFSTLAKLTTTVKRLSSRAGMQELRANRGQGDVPPVGTSKAELLRHYGMLGKIGPSFAQAQLDLDRDPDRTH